MINIYCDESCHLENDNSDIMLLGAITCPKSDIKNVSRDIDAIKERYGLGKEFEIKWTKVSPSKVEFYQELLSYFFNINCLGFRCVIASNKSHLDNKAFNQTYDDWYYKMYWQLLSKILMPQQEYNIYVDIKDTRGGSKIRTLHDILNNIIYADINRIQIIRSNETNLIQLGDLMVGTIGYQNRFLNDGAKVRSKAKAQLCEHLKSLSGRTLRYTTPMNDMKFNIFVWQPRETK